ncbi:MAG: SDR family oxidoreductase [Cyclobacteriaceae bacterium]|nr:SDR family oxidoreductase [Cyclobacteriaceae bacterium]
MLKDKNIVIIGGTTGLGFSAARYFAGQGAKVMVTGRNTDSCRQAEIALQGAGKAFNADACAEGSAEDAIALCMETFGSFDALYHVAGGSGRKFGDGPLHELSLQGWQKTLDMNLTSLMLSNRAAIRHFLEHKKSGVILNMGSVLGFSPSPQFFVTHAYAAAKSAIIGFTRSIASCYAKDNIRINVIAPALVETPMAQRAAGDDAILQFIKTKQPLDGGRIGMPQDYDAMAALLLSDASAFMTGQVVTIDGGWTLSEGQLPISR